MAVIPGGADKLKAGTYIVKTGGYSRNIGAYRVIVYGNYHKAQKQQRAVYSQVGVCIVHDLLVYGFVVHAYKKNSFWVKRIAYCSANTFFKQKNPRDFKTAAGTSGTGTDKHK